MTIEPGVIRGDRCGDQGTADAYHCNLCNRTVGECSHSIGGHRRFHMDRLLKPVYRWIWRHPGRRVQELLRFSETETDGGRDLLRAAAYFRPAAPLVVPRVGHSVERLAPSRTSVDNSGPDRKSTRLNSSH